MDPEEIEFLAENETVEIVPKFNFKKIFLISGEIGPFRAGIPLRVPIWLAANLKSRQKCNLVAPSWMDVEQLEEIKKEETLSPQFYTVPSEYYIIEAQVLIRIADGDIHRADTLRTIIKDIWDNRQAKLRSSIDTFFRHGDVHARLDNLTAMEINSVRPILPYALDLLNRLRGHESSLSLLNASGNNSSTILNTSSFSGSH